MGTQILTFLFTDLEGSTRRWLEDEQAMAAALDRHDRVLRVAIEEHRGSILKHTGDGVLAVFEDPLDAVEGAIAAQHGLRDDPEGDRLLRTRMAIHTGPCRARDGDYFGPTLNRAARIMGAAHGGQVVASSAVAAVVAGSVPLLGLGVHRLRDLLDPEPLHQVVIDDAGRYPPLRSVDVADHNLPAQVTPLIGREEEVSTILELLGSSRLVTLVGMGGVGKTRLAVEVGAHLVDERRVGFVDLAPVVDPDGVPRAVAEALGLPPGEAAEPGALQRALRGRGVVLVLDNCEHVVESCADLVDDLVSSDVTTTVLATSREPLGIGSERVWRVPSLDGEGAAADLFIERTIAAGAALALDDGTMAVVRDICTQLDGIPLAIELAAARTSHLSLDDIAARLHERFQLLTGGRRRSRQRHQTLQAALDWSHDLLSPEHRVVLRHAAVFTGGFTLDALTHVVGSMSNATVLDAVAALVDQSLVIADRGDDRSTRYRLLETVRLYGLDRLAEAGEAAGARQRHVEWVARWLGDPRPGSGKYGDTRRAVERDNVLAALEWLDGADELAQLGALAAAAIDSLTGAVWVDEAWRFLGRTDVDAALAGDRRARYAVAGAANANSVGDFVRQAELAEHGRSLASHGSPEWRTAMAELANAESVFHPDRARQLYEEVLAELPGGATEELGMLLARRADPALMTGRLEEGAALLDEARDLLGVPDFDHGTPHLLLGRADEVRRTVKWFDQHGTFAAFGSRGPLLAGMLGATESRFEDAAGHLVEAARRVERFPVRLVDRDVINGFAVLAHHEGDARRAAELLAVAANGPVWSRTPGMYAVHMHYRRLVGETIDKTEIRQIRAAATDRSVEATLAEEVQRRRVDRSAGRPDR